MSENRRLPFYLAFLLPVCVLGLVFAVLGIYPFGGNQLNLFDLWEQYYPFLFDFQRQARAGGVSLYSWGRSSDYISLYAYYTASPLNLLLIPLPFTALKGAITFLILFKIGLAGLFAAVCLRGVSGKASRMLPVFSSMYALSGFAVAYGWHFMWLDTFALLPLVTLGLYSVLKEGRFKLYIVSLAFAVWCNFFIGIYVCIFTVLMFIYFAAGLGLEPRTVLKKLFAVAGYSAISIGMTMIIMLPTFVASGGFSSTETSAEAFFYHSFFTVISRVLAFAPHTITYGAPNLYSGLFCVFCLTLFFASKKINAKEKFVAAAIFVFIIVSVNFNVLDYMWSGFYVSIGMPSRYTFVFSFLMVLTAYKAYALNDEKDAVKIIVYAAAFTGLVLGAAYIGLADARNIALNALFMAVYTAAFAVALKSGKLEVKRIACLIIAAAALFEAGVTARDSYAAAGMRPDWGNYPEDYNSIAKLLDKCDDEALFSRTELADAVYFNDNAIYGFNGISFYSSTADSDVSDFLTGFGLRGWRFGKMHGYVETSPLPGMFLSVRYLISRDGQTTDNGIFWMQRGIDGKAALFENRYFLPFGFITDEALLGYNGGNDNPFHNQNDFFRRATGLSNDLFLTVEAVPAHTGYEPQSFSERPGYYRYTPLEINAQTTTVNGREYADRQLRYEAGMLKDGLLYVYYADPYISEIFIEKNDESFSNYYMHHTPFAFPAGFVSEGDNISLLPSALNPAGEHLLYAAVIDMEILDAGYDILSKETLDLIKFSGSFIKGETITENGGLMYMSVPYNSFWRVYINGAEAEKLPVGGGMSAVRVAPGSHIIELKYRNIPFYAGLCVSAVSAAAFILLLKRKQYKTGDRGGAK